MVTRMARAQGGRDGDLDAVAWTDEPILVPRTFAGRSFQVTVGGLPAVLTLPLSGPDSFHASSSGGARPLPTLPPPPLAEPLSPKIFSAGGVSRPTPPHVLVIEGFRLRWRDGELAEKLRANELAAQSSFIEVLGDWLSSVGDWLAVWSGNPRSFVQLPAPPRVRIAAPGSPMPHEAGGGGVPVFVTGLRSSSADELKGAFAAASLEMQVPLEWRLLSEASVHVLRRERRHAVISACGAAEVALAAEARRVLARAGRKPAEIKAILDRVSGVVELYRLSAARRQGLAVSIGQVMNQLAKPRNEAAHEGADIDEDAARDALRTAKALVEVCPLPRPRALARQLKAL